MEQIAMKYSENSQEKSIGFVIVDTMMSLKKKQKQIRYKLINCSTNGKRTLDIICLDKFM